VKDKLQSIEDISQLYIARLRTYVELNFPNLREETDDIVQSILEKMLNRYDRYNSAYSLNTWVYSMAHNYCIDLFRKQKRRDRYQHIQELPMDLKDPTDSPEAEVEQQWEREHLKKVFSTLPEIERQVLFLSIYEEIKLSEIAKIMNKPLGSIKSLKYRAKQRIKKQWEDKYAG